MKIKTTDRVLEIGCGAGGIAKFLDCNYVGVDYFPSEEYAEQVICEMQRIAKEAIFIGDLPITSHRDTHLFYKKETFLNWRIMEPDYNPLRFNAYLEL